MFLHTCSKNFNCYDKYDEESKVIKDQQPYSKIDKGQNIYFTKRKI